MVQRHSVVIPREDGGIEVYPLKEWLRQHPEQTPSGLHPNSSTSHQLRNALRLGKGPLAPFSLNRSTHAA
jgi:endonuclease